MIHIEGSHSEGGGQILRTALALSVLTGKPFRADRIRHHRPRPGLKNQHLTCIRALEQIAKVHVEGARLGSAVIEFFPAAVMPGTYSIDIGTAGSITLLLQALLLPCMFADGPIQLNVTGGTDTKWSIPIDFFSRLILPFFRECAGIELKKIQRGFYPKGQGVVELAILPKFHIPGHKDFADFIARLKTELPVLQLTQKSAPIKIQGVSAASVKLKNAKVAERQGHGAVGGLHHLCPVEIGNEYCRTASPGTVISLWTVDQNRNIYIGADALGERGKLAEAVGEEAAGKLMRVLNSDAVVDHHLADNLIPLLALLGGRIITSKITGHIHANIYVCEKFLNVHFEIDEKRNEIAAV